MCVNIYRRARTQSEGVTEEAYGYACYVWVCACECEDIRSEWATLRDASPGMGGGLVLVRVCRNSCECQQSRGFWRHIASQRREKIKQTRRAHILKVQDYGLQLIHITGGAGQVQRGLRVHTSVVWGRAVITAPFRVEGTDPCGRSLFHLSLMVSVVKHKETDP